MLQNLVDTDPYGAVTPEEALANLFSLLDCGMDLITFWSQQIIINGQTPEASATATYGYIGKLVSEGRCGKA